MNFVGLFIALLLIIALAGAPSFHLYDHGYGWYPTGGAGLIILIVLILVIFRGL